MTEAVEEKAEETAPVESAPIETKPDDSQPAETTEEAPVEGNQPEKKVTDTVPYDRFKEVNDRQNDPNFIRQKAEEMGLIQPVAPVQEDNPFDETTTQGVASIAEQVASKAFERREAQRWVNQHQDDLKDPLVDSRVKDLIRQGVDRDSALNQAKKELDGRTTTVKKEALAEGVQEGQQLANKKDQMGAVGTSGTQKVDPENMSSEEMRKYYGIERV